MALSLWTQANLQTRVFADLGQQDSADNELLTAQQVQDALYIAEQQFARDARALRRTATINAVDEQREYALPEDLFAVSDVWYDDDLLKLTDEANLAVGDPDYRTRTGTPSYWYTTRQGRIALYDAPDGVTDETIDIDGYCVPHSIGGSITALARASNVVTVTTAAAHNLRVGDSVTISGCGTATFNAAYTVATVTSTSFTAAQTGADATVSSTFGYAYYTGGALPMLASTDVPALPLAYRPALAFYAVFWLSRLQLRTDPAAQDAGQIAFAAYADLVRRYLGETAV